MQAMKRKKHKAQQFEMPIASEAFNLEQETTQAPQDDKGHVYVVEIKRGKKSWLMHNGIKMSRAMVELNIQDARKIWKDASFIIKDTTEQQS